MTVQEIQWGKAVDKVIQVLIQPSQRAGMAGGAGIC